MRRHKALQAKPNPGHYALTELAKKIPDFITLTQNVDGKLYSHLLRTFKESSYVILIVLIGTPFSSYKNGKLGGNSFSYLKFRLSSEWSYSHVH